MMRVTIDNPARQEGIWLELPKTDRELTEAMETIGIASVIPKGVLTDAESGNLPLLRLRGTEVNVDELNFLAKRMETLTDYERKKFAACCEAKTVDGLKDLINLTYNLHDVSLIDDYTDIEAIGRRIYLDGHAESGPEDMAGIDFEDYACEHMAQKPGKSTIYGTLLPSDFHIWQIYEGQVFPRFYYDEKAPVCISIQNAAGLEEHLYLPTDTHSMDKAKERLGVAWFSDCEVTEIHSKRLGDIHPFMGAEDIMDLTRLNELCRVVYDFDDGQMERLRMAVEFAGADDTLAITGLARHLDSFEILAGIHNDHDYGRFIVEESGLFAVDELLLPYIDYESFAGNKRASTLVQSGYVAGGFVGTLRDIKEILDYRGDPNEILEPEKRPLTFRLFSPLHAAATMERDGTNTGISTAATPINKKKVIPNTRRGSNKTKGGQPGHKRHTMAGFDSCEITDIIEHELDIYMESCDLCKGELVDTGETESKDEFDVTINVVKRRHNYHIYECVDCGSRVRQSVNRKLKETNQYGSNIQAAALSLMVTANVAINKVRMLINGMTKGEMNPSEGFICKLYQRASLELAEFMTQVRLLIIRRAVVYWDDTVIMIQTRRACMRFYGDETISYYTAHVSKDFNGLIEDNVLSLLTPETIVMHDHNKVNYNERFCFQNIECNQHLGRDLQKVADDNPEHTWSAKMKSRISMTIKERKDSIASGLHEFGEEYVMKFKKEMNRLIQKGYKESAVSTNPTTVPSENTLLSRIEKYFDNYFRWVEDFTLPTTDNLSERGLRSIKSHMKISGQFESEKTASNYAIVKTYVETCRKNSINEMDALSRLCAGTPFTVTEIFSEI